VSALPVSLEFDPDASVFSGEYECRETTEVLLNKTEFWTDDVDQAIQHLSGRYVHHSRVPVGKFPFSWGYRSIASTNLTVGIVKSRGANVLKTGLPGSVALVHIPIGNAKTYRIGRRTLEIRPGHGLVMPPGYAYTSRDPGGSTLAIVVDAGALMDELEQLWPGRRGHLALRATELHPTKRGWAGLQRLLWRIDRLNYAEPTAPDREDVAFVKDEIVSWLAAEIVRHNGIEPLSPARRRRVEWIERWIEANLDEPIDLAELAKAAGIGARALAKTTHAARGVTPMDLVLSRRLEKARHLLSRDDADTVARAASDAGFTHLGRFAAAYLDAYGELPSETIARHRRDP